MNEERGPPRIGKRSLLLLVLGLLLFIPLVEAFDLSTALVKLKEIGIIPILLSFISIHIGVFFYNLGWYYLLDREAPFTDVFLIGWTSLFINLLIPAGSAPGEVARVYFITKVTKSRITPAKALSTVIAHRAVMMIPFLLTIALGFSFLIEVLGGSSTGVLAIGSSVVLVITIFVLIYRLSTSPDPILRLIGLFERKLSRDLSKWKESVVEYSGAFKGLIKRRKLLLIALICAFLNWFFDMLPIFIYFHAIGHSIDPLMGMLIYSVSILMLLIPVGIPGNTGLREWVMTGLLAALGLSVEVALAITLIASTVTLFLNELVFGLITYLLVLKRLPKED